MRFIFQDEIKIYSMVNTMQNIILNIDELEKINLNESMIYEILKIPNFINKIRYIDSSGKP